MDPLSSGMEIPVLRDCKAITIPDGEEIDLHAGSNVIINQVLGGMFSVETEEGYFVRIDGKDADAIGQPIPDESKGISEQDLAEKSIKDLAWQQMRTCYDPEIPINVVEIGLIYQCEVSELDGGLHKINVEMTLTAPGCGMGEVLKSDVERKLREIPSVSEVQVELVFDPAWEPSMMSEAARLQLGMF